MSTHGAYGFRVDHKDYVSYNHCDSYPECLGKEILKNIKSLLTEYSLEELKTKVKSIKLIQFSEQPTEKDVVKLKLYTNLDIGDRNNKDWYCLTHGMQGKLLLHLKSGYMADSAIFLLDSIFCQWAYILNLDDEVLEVYKGFVKQRGNGRYDSIEMKQSKDINNHFGSSYGVSLVVAYPLKALLNIKSLTAMVYSLI